MSTPMQGSRSTYVALVNLRSGGLRTAQYVRRKLCDTLGPDKVWMLFEIGDTQTHDAELAQFLAEQAPDCVIVAGGDGTISFAMDMIKNLHERRLLPRCCGAIAPFPLGTGNDLSITLGFGSGFARWVVLGDRRFHRLLKAYETATIRYIDRWSLRVTTTTADHPEGLVHNYVLNNYFSIGCDAAVANRLNQFRVKHPNLFVSRPIVKLWYAAFAILTLLTEERIGSSVLLEIDNRHVQVPARAKSVAVCNMLTYAGGATAWKATTGRRYVPPSVSDGRLEVVCFYGIWHLALVRLGCCYGTRLGQGGYVNVETACHSSQFDGEEISKEAGADGVSKFRIEHFSNAECLSAPPPRETNVALLALGALAATLLALLFLLLNSAAVF